MSAPTPVAAPRMAVIEEIETGANELRKLFWMCNAGHHGIALLGFEPVCSECCHGGQVPSGFTCNRCGATA